MKTMRTLFVIGATALLVACAGTPFDWNAARQVRPGMSEGEVVALMGRPYLVKATESGVLWVWSYANALGGARSMSVAFKDGVVVKAPQIPDTF